MSEPIQHVCTKCGYIASTQYGHSLAERIRTLEAEVERLQGLLLHRSTEHLESARRMRVECDAAQARVRALEAEVERLGSLVFDHSNWEAMEYQRIKQAREEEREACAKIAVWHARHIMDDTACGPVGDDNCAPRIARAIRARAREDQ